METGVNKWTPEIEAMYGLPPGNFKQTQAAWEDLVQPEDRVEVRRRVEETFQTGTLGEAEWRVVWPDGSIHWLTGRWQVFKNGEDRPVRVAGINFDITDRKRAEHELLALKHQLTIELEGMRRLQEISAKLISDGDFQALSEEIVEAAMLITKADMGNMQLLDENTGSLVIVAQRRFERDFLEFFHHVHDGLAACGTALKAKQRVIVEDVARHPIFRGTTAGDVMLKAGAHAVQSTPLVARGGKLLGVLSTHYRLPSRPDERDLRLLDMLARTAADFIERVKMRRHAGET